INDEPDGENAKRQKRRRSFNHIIVPNDMCRTRPVGEPHHQRQNKRKFDKKKNRLLHGVSCSAGTTSYGGADFAGAMGAAFGAGAGAAFAAGSGVGSAGAGTFAATARCSDIACSALSTC